MDSPFPSFKQILNTGWKNPADYGTADWATPEEILIRDDVYASVEYKGLEPTTLVVGIWYDDEVKGTQKTEALRVTEGMSSFGGQTDLWDTSITVVNANTVAFGVQIMLDDGNGAVLALRAINFSLGLPENSQIAGYEVNVEYYSDGLFCYVDAIALKVYYY